MKRRARPAGHATLVDSDRLCQRAGKAYYDDRDLAEAVSLLQHHERQAPLPTIGLKLYWNVLMDLGDVSNAARIGLELADRCPNDPEAQHWAGVAAQMVRLPASIVVHFQQMLTLAPNHPEAERAKKEIEAARQELADRPETAGYDDDWSRESAAEKIEHAADCGGCLDAIRRAEKYLLQYPADLAIRRILVSMMVMTGNYLGAVKAANESLQLSPDDFVVLTMRCKSAWFLGQRAQSGADARRLQELEPESIDALNYAAEAFAVCGDLAGIEWAFHHAERRGWLENPRPTVAFLLHFDATRQALLGQTEAATRRWKLAAELGGEMTLAEWNLKDQQRPREKRWGPAFFRLSDWLSPSQFGDLAAWPRPSSAEGKDPSEFFQVIRPAVERFCKRHPDILRAIPAMLARGDGESQEMAAVLAMASSQESIRSALHDYVMGERGNLGFRAHLLAGLSARMHETGRVFVYELPGATPDAARRLHAAIVTDEPKPLEGRSDEVHEMLFEAMGATNQERPADAVQLLREARKIESDQPDVLNNLAATLQAIGRFEEAEVIVNELLTKFPDYFFGKIILANRKSMTKKFGEALTILNELQQRKRFHRTEFIVLANALLTALIGLGRFGPANTWLTFLEALTPYDQNVIELRQHLDRLSSLTTY